MVQQQQQQQQPPARNKFPFVRDYNSARIQKEFLKEKLRVRERYWRPAKDVLMLPEEEQEDDDDDDEPKADDSNVTACWIIPDGVIWRKYLPLLTLLVEQQEVIVCRLFLLESAVEWMDYRNVSPCVTTEDGRYIPESSAMQERHKIQKLMQTHAKSVFPFCDLSIQEEECDEWDLLGYSAMSIAERSRHALLRAGRILQQQQCSTSTSTSSMSTSNAEIWLLSSDSEFIAQFPSEEDGVQIMVIDHLVELLVQRNNLVLGGDEIIEKIRLLKDRCEEEYRLRNAARMSKGRDSAAQEYISADQIQDGLRNGMLVKGRLNVTTENPREATVSVHGGETYYINQQLGHFNRTFHQDIVVLQPLPQSEWGHPVGRRRLVHHRDDDDENNNNSAVAEADVSQGVPSARVVAIASPSRRQFVATMTDLPGNEESACLVIPRDIRIPKIRIQTNAWRNFVNQRLLVQVDAWEPTSNYPQGRCIEILGPIADLETEIACLLHENEVFLDPFSAASQACLPKEGPQWQIPQEEIQKRRDLRMSCRIFSVDPPGCQDIDDTMHARVLPNGDIEVGVHIADVTYFVPHNSPLDKEAQVRGTTFYLVDRRFDMLPSLLSSDLCSLHGNTDRLAVSAIWIMSSDLKEIKSVWYGRTCINNCQAMTYDQAHNILHDKPPDDPRKPKPPPLTAGAPVNPENIKALKHDLQILTKLSRKLRKDREEIGGAVDLSSGDLGNELKFTLDKNNNPTRVSPKKDLEIHHTIAEMMILANSWVASRIHDDFPDSALLRVHRSADEDRFEDLKEVLDAGKIDFDGSSNMALANSLKKAESGNKSGSLVNSLFKSLATRAMSEAQYISSGSHEEGTLSHYGLGLERYTHFTSPIRRYADVIVHKQLLASLEKRSIAPATVLAAPATEKLRRGVLDQLPGSKVISILGGEGIVEEPKSKYVQEVFAGNTDVASGGTQDVSPHSAPSENLSDEDVSESKLKVQSVTPYRMKEVSRICDGLNRHNRLAKLSSMECQRLFLSLYFKDHVETTQAVVTNLRMNGLWVYVPRFDLKGPVYLTDSEGALHIDPVLLGLEPTAGAPPARGFAASDESRKFPGGNCQLVSDSLEVTAPGCRDPFLVRPLDVVTVQIRCDSWDVRARVPSPRLHLVSNDKGKASSPAPRKKATDAAITSTMLAVNRKPGVGKISDNLPFTSKKMSMYDALKLETPSVLFEAPLRSQLTQKQPVETRKVTITGRLIFDGFVNPDTRSAVQEAAIEAASAAAMQRREQVVANRARVSEYDTSRRIENNIMARTQKLSAGKRNTRKASAK